MNDKEFHYECPKCKSNTLKYLSAINEVDDIVGYIYRCEKCKTEFINWYDLVYSNTEIQGEWEMKETKEVMVTIRFLYSKEDGKDEQYYKDKAFEEIYNSDDVLNADGFDVKESKRWKNYYFRF